MADTRWLQQRGRGFYVVKAVPRPLQATLGKRLFIRSLHTRDLHVALARRHTALAEFESEIARARHRTEPSPLIEAGMAWRDTFARIDRAEPQTVQGFARGRRGDPHDQRGDHVPDHVLAREGAESVFSDDLERLAETHGYDAAGVVQGIAFGTATPLLHYVDAWLAEGGARGPVAARTQSQYRADLTELEAWANGVGVPTIEGFTPRIAGRFVTESFVAGGIHRKTANRKISVASSYWRWLVKRAGIAANPWAGQSLSKRVPAGGASLKPRPFTDAEMVALLGGNADAELADAMRCAALSGVRIEELYRLTVATVAGGWFDIGEAKSDAGVRRVPIHPDLADIVARRCAGKTPSAYLFHEAGAIRPGRERSMAASKRFGHYRKRVGVDERAEGRGSPGPRSIRSAAGSSPRHGRASIWRSSRPSWATRTVI